MDKAPTVRPLSMWFYQQLQACSAVRRVDCRTSALRGLDPVPDVVGVAGGFAVPAVGHPAGRHRRMTDRPVVDFRGQKDRPFGR